MSQLLHKHIPRNVSVQITGSGLFLPTERTNLFVYFYLKQQLFDFKHFSCIPLCLTLYSIHAFFVFSRPFLFPPAVLIPMERFSFREILDIAILHQRSLLNDLGYRLSAIVLIYFIWSFSFSLECLNARVSPSFYRSARISSREYRTTDFTVRDFFDLPYSFYSLPLWVLLCLMSTETLPCFTNVKSKYLQRCTVIRLPSARARTHAQSFTGIHC